MHARASREAPDWGARSGSKMGAGSLLPPVRFLRLYFVVLITYLHCTRQKGYFQKIKLHYRGDIKEAGGFNVLRQNFQFYNLFTQSHPLSSVLYLRDGVGISSISEFSHRTGKTSWMRTKSQARGEGGREGERV